MAPQFFPFDLTSDEHATAAHLGGKGAGLVWLVKQGVSVPPGFVIPTSVWAEYDKKPKTTMKLIAKALPYYLQSLKDHFGYMPLLSVRSGARVSCPGMMDTILNVGIDASTMGEWTNRLGPQCFADSFHRLVVMYGNVVKSIRREILTPSLKVALDEYAKLSDEPFPDAEGQLLGAIEAVFKSWDNDRAEEYRKMHGYDRAWGTAVTVQAMVFGNLNDQSATGVLFTRNPDTGELKVTGEWLPNAQGEDIVAGLRTPLKLDDMQGWNSTLHATLLKQVIGLEDLKRDMLDIEFTVQDGKLYLLQVRSGKRSALAALKIAVDMKTHGLLTAKEAVSRVSVKEFDLAQTTIIDPSFTKPASFVGLGACSGIVSGKPVFSKEDAISCKVPCILVSHETTPDDIAGMNAARGVLTMVGGITSHAAVVARGMNRVCVVGLGVEIDIFKDADFISIDGETGRVWMEQVPTIEGQKNGVREQFNTLVAEAAGITPVIFDVPLYPMKEALLYLGDKVLDTANATDIVVQTMMKVGRLYLDLVPTEEENRFLKLVAAYDHTDKLLSSLQYVVGDTKVNLVVIVPAKYSTVFPRITPGADLHSLVLSDAEIVMDGVDTSDPAMAKVLAWKKAEGVTVVSIGTYVEGAKSLLSIPQAMQLLTGKVA